MIKIKTNLFESILAVILLPNLVLVLTTIFLVISLIVEQETIVYQGIAIVYAVCFLALAVGVGICTMASKNSKKQFVVQNDSFQYLNRTYLLEQIEACEYYVCKWYFIPIAFIYKEQVAGLIIFKLNTGDTIQFRIFYKDYLKLKNTIKNILEK
ncbi:MAG: hypothetical protein IJF10_05855 [Clostridia bacterium]|nr:hypothetical protein [Clostridia bacterium]